ncbi:MAG: DNA integrity scanning diadenylate cyclase DisA [bacterium]|nr:DNA integrity scanning diadenylate cyclase DisA [bacterium]MDE0601233.1 DNA integrity scanning diadenylate cyclase DisA [bacterium]
MAESGNLFASLKAVVGDRTTQEVVERLFSHRPIRDGLERILQAREGALIVLGSNPDLQYISVDGLQIASVGFDAARLSEVAKMDGAIILDNSWKSILTANAHLSPPVDLPTTESGSRHRTAQRTAHVTGLPVVTVSKDRAVVTLYFNSEQADLTPRWTIHRRILHHLQILVMMRKRFDEAEEHLLRMELLGLVTSRDVAHVLRLGELVVRAASGIEAMVVDSAQDPDTTAAVVADRVFEVERLVQLTLMDYLGDDWDEARGTLAGLMGHKLAYTWLVDTEVGLADLDAELIPRGHRLLYRTGVVTKRLRVVLLGDFPDAQALLHAPLERFMEVKGVGHKTATRLRHYFDRLLAAVHPIGQRVLTDGRNSYNPLP